MREIDGEHGQDSGERHLPSELPPDLATFLRDQTFGCLTHPTDHGTVLLIKAPRVEIESARGTVPIALRHELHDCQSAPVIRMLLTIYDQPNQPLALETFINVQDPEQRSDYATLADQPTFYLLVLR